MLSSIRWMLVLLVIVVLSFGFSTLCETQGLMPASPSLSGGIIRQSDTVPVSSGMISNLLPNIPNLQFGFHYFFGDKVRSGQANADYVLPVSIGNEAVLFGEAHGNYWDFGQRPPGGASHRVDLSLGGGFRKILADHLLLGVNGFYDSSRLFNQWYSSGGLGLEMAANVGCTDALDLNANWYGNLFASNSILNAFRNKGGSYDIEAGYSHAMFDETMDLRLKFAGYQFDVGNDGNNVYGYKTGADLTTRDGMFTVRYEYGNDRINGPWNNIGGFVNVGFQMENIIKGESPFTMPEPIFKSPRNLRRMLTQKVRRDWNQQYAPGRATLASAAVGGGCSLSRTVASGEFHPSVFGSVYLFNEVVPNGDLIPDRYVTVTFQYTVDRDDANCFVYVGASPNTGDGMGAVEPHVSTSVSLTAPSGTVSVQLCPAQSNFTFTLNVCNPDSVAIGSQYGSGSFTNMIICFNQADNGSCPAP